MLIDARDLSSGARMECDVCVVGAGAAGITVARELQGSGLGVCLLESGGFEKEEATQRLYGGRESGLEGAGIRGCRLRYFGGTTNHWTGWCRPLEAADFERRDWIEGSGWPISLADLEPYYRRAHRTCELGAYEYDVLARDGRGGKCLALDPERVRTVFYQRSPPTRFGIEYREELASASDIRVILHSNLVEIVLDGEGDGVARLRCSTLEGVELTVRARAYVVAAGGVENARLLLASNRQRDAGLGNENDLVGRFFMQHPHYYDGAHAVLRTAPHLGAYRRWHRARTREPEGGGERWASVLGALALAPDVLERHGLTALTCTLREVEEDETEERTGPLEASDVAALLRGNTGGERLVSLTMRGEQRPRRESRVRLIEAVDALGMPRVEVDWRVADQDRRDLQRSLELIGAELGRAGIGRLWIPLDEEGGYRHEEFGARGGCHHMGTTRMSASPREGVVDRDGKIHSVRNLYVAGSSVFPTVGFANPTLTIVALAHRLADHLRQRWL